MQLGSILNPWFHTYHLQTVANQSNNICSDCGLLPTTALCPLLKGLISIFFLASLCEAKRSDIVAFRNAARLNVTGVIVGEAAVLTNDQSSSIYSHQQQTSSSTRQIQNVLPFVTSKQFWSLNTYRAPCHSTRNLFELLFCIFVIFEIDFTGARWAAYLRDQCVQHTAIETTDLILESHISTIIITD